MNRFGGHILQLGIDQEPAIARDVISGPVSHFAVGMAIPPWQFTGISAKLNAWTSCQGEAGSVSRFTYACTAAV